MSEKFNEESCDCSSEGFLDLEIDGEEPKEGFFEKLAGVFRKNDNL